MKIKTTLLTLAAALIPLTGCNNSTKAEEADAAAEAAASTRLEAQHGALTPLSLIPADVDLCISITDIPARAKSIASLAGGSPDAVEGICVTNAAIAVGKGAAGSFGALCSTQSYDMMRSLYKLASVTNTQAKPELQEALMAALRKAVDTQFDVCVQAMPKIKIPTVYCVLTPAPGQEEKLKSLVDVMFAHLCTEENFSKFEHAGFSGVKSDGAKAKKKLEESNARRHEFMAKYGLDEDGDYVDRKHREMNKKIEQFIVNLFSHDYYLLSSMKNGQLVIILCSDLSQLDLPDTPGASLLGAPQYAAMDAHLGDDIILTMSCSAGMAESYFKNDDIIELIASISIDVFKNAAKADNGNAARYQAARKGVEYLQGLYSKMVADINAEGPALALLWQDGGGFHFQTSAPATKAHKCTPATFRHRAIMDDPETVFAYVGSPNEQKIGCPLGKLVTAGLDIRQGYLAFTGETDEDDPVTLLQPEISAAAQALDTAWSGLDGVTFFMIDGKATPPASGSLGTCVCLPRYAFYSDVKDRSKLSAGWDALLGAARQALPKLGQDTGMLDMMPIVPEPVDGGTSYTVSIPGYTTPDFCGNITLGDSGFVMGSSANLNKEIFTHSGKEETICGSRFVIRTAPLLKALKANLGQDEPAERSWDEPEYGYGYDDYYGRSSRRSRNAEILSALEAIADKVDSVSGSSGVTNGMYILQLDIKTK